MNNVDPLMPLSELREFKKIRADLEKRILKSFEDGNCAPNDSERTQEIIRKIYLEWCEHWGLDINFE